MPLPTSTNSDPYVWTNRADWTWNTPANWRDATTGADPATGGPGAGNPVSITGYPSLFSPLPVTGGGAAASVDVTQYVALEGTYTVGAITVHNGALVVRDAGSSLAASGPVGAGALPASAPASAADYGSVGEIDVQGGAAMTVRGDMALDESSQAEVKGVGSRLVVAGTLTLTGDRNTPGFAAPSLAASNGGVIQVAGLSVQNPGGLANSIYSAFGNIRVSNTSSIEVGSAGNAAAGAITVDAGRTLTLAGDVFLTNNFGADDPGSPMQSTLVVDDGTVALSDGTTTVGGNVSGTGRWQIGTKGTLTVNGTVAAGDTIAFAGSGATLRLGTSSTGTPYTMGATLSGFASGDSIALSYLPVTGAAYAATGADTGTLSLFNGARLITTLTLSGSYDGRTFTVAPSSSGGTVTLQPTSSTLLDGPGRHLYVAENGHSVLTADTTAHGTSTSLAPNGDMVLARDDQTHLLRGITEVEFSDGRLVFDPNDPVAQVARLYQAGFGRQPDAGGLSYWTDAVRHGASLGQIAQGFLGSAEAMARFGQGGSNADFVTAIYTDVLGRAPDGGGAAYWTGLLKEGKSRADVLAGISESVENKQATASLVSGGLWAPDQGAAEAARMYDAVFGRLPDAGGLGYWTQQLDTGATTLQGMAQDFVSGPEFQQVYGSLSDHDFVQAIYAHTLHRAGDPAGVEYWTAQLDAGGSRAAVVAGFSESPEHQQLTAADITGNTPGHWGIATA